MTLRRHALIVALASACGIARATGCDTLIGDWNWFTGGKVTVTPNNTLLYDGSKAGRWNCLDPAQQAARLVWNIGTIDTVSVAGNHLTGTNDQGINVHAERRSAPANRAATTSAEPAAVTPPTGNAMAGRDGHGQQVPYPEQTLSRMNIAAALSAQQIFELGTQLGTQHRTAESAAAFLKCSDMGNMRCTAALGLMYDQGRGVPLDRVRAVWYLTRAANAGNRGAAYQIGVYWEDGEILPQDLKKAMDWYLKSAELGLSQAERRVGLAYELGEIVPRSRAKAIEWLAKAAAQGDGMSGEIVGILRNPNSPAQFRDLDALAAYYQSLYRAQFAIGPPRGGGYNGNSYAHGNAVAAYMAAGDPAGAATCQATPSCRH